MKRQMDTDIKSVASRVWNRVKKAGKLAAEILDPSSHNIDNPDNKKYYEKPEYWEAREKDEAKMGLHTPRGDEGIER